MNITEFDNLNKELEEAGVPYYEFMGEKMSPVNTLISTNTSSKPYLDILLKYLPKSNSNILEAVVRALTEKGNTKASPYLLDLFKNFSRHSDALLWAVGNALSVIDDKSTYSAILELCKDKRLGASRQMLLGILAKIKAEEPFNVLIGCLNEPALKGHAIEALGKQGDPRTIKVLEEVQVEKGKYEYKAKHAALRRLTKQM